MHIISDLGSADFTQVHMNLIHGHDNEAAKIFETLTLFSRSHWKKLLNLSRKPLNAHFLQSGSTDYTQI